MCPEIKDLVNKGKTCAPVLCADEWVCFMLACEVERLHQLLGTSVEAEPVCDSVPLPVSVPIPTFESTNCLWEKYND